MVYINSRGEVVDETLYRNNIFWKIVYFFVMFFRTLVGWEETTDKKNDDRSRGVNGGRFSTLYPGGGGGGGNGGGSSGSGGPNSNKGPRPFGPRGIGRITDPPPAPPMMGCSSGGCCG